MHYVEIAEQIFEQGHRTAETANPTSSVAAIIAQSFSKERDKSPFVRVGRGQYGLRETNKPTGRSIVEELTETGSSGITGVINAFGMFWDRSKVKWESEPLILGQKSGAKAVNFGGQRGVYLLHDAQGVVYVGRTTDQSLGKRLHQHTSDRLTGRWTPFFLVWCLSSRDRGFFENRRGLFEGKYRHGNRDYGSCPHRRIGATSKP